MLEKIWLFFRDLGSLPIGPGLAERSDLFWFIVICNSVTGFSYLLILMRLLAFARERRDIQRSWTCATFMFFLGVSAINQFFEVGRDWDTHLASYGLVKLLITASALTGAIFFKYFLEKLAALPRIDELSAATESLEQEKVRRLLSQQELALRDQQLQLIIDQLPVALVYFDQDLRVRLCNSTYEKWQAQTQNSSIGLKLNEFSCFAGQGQLEAGLTSALSGVAHDFEGELPGADPKRWVSIQDIPDTTETGAVRGVIRLITDITAFRQSQLQLKEAKERADAANQAKSIFVAHMSHEIRTPLAAVLGYADLLTRDNLSLAERKKFMATIRRNSELLLHIVADVLDISKMEAGHIELGSSAFALRELVQDTTQPLALQASSKGIELRVGVDPSVPQYIVSDPFRLKQILINLISNSIKYSEQGPIDLQVYPKFGATPLLAFSVRDQGRGMSLEQQQQVFQPFYQAGLGAMQALEGVGLGLALSKGLAQLLGGDLQLLASAPELGCCFELTIACGSLQQEEAAEAQGISSHLSEAAASSERLDGARILLVEDARDNQLLIQNYLESAGAEVSSASNGLEALALLEESDVDVVLMDLQMPLLGGMDAMRELQRRGYSRPVIALTAHTMCEERQSCLDAGFNLHLGKPVDPRELIAAINACRFRAAVTEAWSEQKSRSEAPAWL